MGKTRVRERAVLEHSQQPGLLDLGQLTVRIKVLYTQGLDVVGWSPGHAPGEAYLFLLSETRQVALLPDPGLACAVLLSSQRSAFILY